MSSRIVWIGFIIVTLSLLHCGPLRVEVPQPSELTSEAKATEDSGAADIDEPIDEVIPELAPEPTPEITPEPTPPPSCNQGLQRDCRLSGVGVCGQGNQKCLPVGLDGKWGACTLVGQKTKEVCDGRDNDCDGKVDEDFLKKDCCVPLTSFSRIYHTKVSVGTYKRALSPDRQELAFLDFKNQEIRIASPHKDINLRKFKAAIFSASSFAITYHPTQHWLAVGGQGRKKTDIAISLYDAKTGKLLRTFKGRESTPPATPYNTSKTDGITFSPDGTLITATFDMANGLPTAVTRRQIVIWRTSDGSIVQTINTQQAYIKAVAFSHDNKLMATGAENDEVKIWQLPSGTLLHKLDRFVSMKAYRIGIWSLDFHPQKPHLITASANTDIRVWHTGTGALLKQFVYPSAPPKYQGVGYSGPPIMLRYSPSGQWVLIAAFISRQSIDRRLGFHIWNADTYDKGHTIYLSTPKLYIRDVRWDNDSQAFTIIEVKGLWRFTCTR